MGRGAQSTTRNLTDQQLAQQNQLISQSDQNSQQDRSTITGPRSRPAQQPRLHARAAVRDHAAEPRRVKRSLRFAPPARPLRRINSAGPRRSHGATRPRTGADRRQPGAAKPDCIRESGEKRSARGLNALGQTYGIDTNLLGKAMGVPSELLSVRQRASGGSSTSGLGSIFGLAIEHRRIVRLI